MRASATKRKTTRSVQPNRIEVTQDMAKNRVTPDRFPTYSEALAALRSRARADVGEAIRDAHSSLPARVRQRANAGHQYQHLFEGLIEAFADQIMVAAMPGHQIEMAEHVAKHLVRLVEIRVCGRLQ